MSNLNEEIPVFFFHMGNPSYLEKIIAQAKETNERVILLGDALNKSLDVEHHNVEEYLYDFETFNQAYQHMSTNPAQFEVVCFIRWFVLRNFMIKNDIDVCFYADSDIMIYGDLAEEWKKFKEFTCAFMMPDEQNEYAWSASGHNSYWTRAALIEFCDFLSATYSSEEGLNTLKDKWHFHIENSKPGGICDMTLFWLYHRLKEGKGIGILSSVHEDSTFDDNIASSENRYKDEYRMKSGVKDIEFRDGIPHCFNLREEKWVRFNTLHFSGAGTKHLIGQ